MSQKTANSNPQAPETVTPANKLRLAPDSPSTARRKREPRQKTPSGAPGNAPAICSPEPATESPAAEEPGYRAHTSAPPAPSRPVPAQWRRRTFRPRPAHPATSTAPAHIRERPSLPELAQLRDPSSHSLRRPEAGPG